MSSDTLPLVSVSTFWLPSPGSGVIEAKAPTAWGSRAVVVSGAAPAWIVARSAPAQYWGPGCESEKSCWTKLMYQSLSTTSSVSWKPGSLRGMLTQPSK